MNIILGGELLEGFSDNFEHYFFCVSKIKTRNDDVVPTSWPEMVQK